MKTIWKGLALIGVFVAGITSVLFLQPYLFDGDGTGNGNGAAPKTITNVTLILDYENGTVDILEDISITGMDPSIYDLLVQNCSSVEHDDYGWDVLVTGLNGRNAGGGKSWFVFVNREYASVGSKQYSLENDDIIEWQFLGKAWDYSPVPL